MSTVTETPTNVKRPGGRPQSEGWNLYGFEKVDGTKGKSLARCRKCGNTLKNTSVSRMVNHHKRCSASNQVVQKAEQIKADPNEPEHEEQMIETVVWETNTDNVQHFLADPIENAPPAELEIIQEDPKRHRKSIGSKPHVNSQMIDAQLSSFLIGCNLTFDLIDSPHFKDFMAALNPNYVVPSSAQLRARVISQLQSPGRSKSSKKRRYYDSSASDSM